MNGILDLQRDLRANDFGLREEYTFGIRTLLFAFVRESRLRWKLGVSSRILLTLHLSASVSWRWDAYLCNAWHCWFHWNFQLLSRFRSNGVQILQLRWEEYRKNSFYDVQLVFGVFQLSIPAVLSFEHIWTNTTTLLVKSFPVSI